jgi:hypothetical protein
MGLGVPLRALDMDERPTSTNYGHRMLLGKSSDCEAADSGTARWIADRTARA